VLHVAKSGDLVRKLVHVRKDAQKDLTQCSCSIDLLGGIFPMHLPGTVEREPTVPLPRVVLNDPGKYFLIKRILRETSMRSIFLIHF
jgi:hypothetical protein